MCMVNISLWGRVSVLPPVVTCQPLVRSPKHAVCSPEAPPCYACVFANCVNWLENK